MGLSCLNAGVLGKDEDSDSPMDDNIFDLEDDIAVNSDDDIAVKSDDEISVDSDD